MLDINLEFILKTRGITGNYAFFKRIGLSDRIASKLHRKNYARLNYATIEALCIALRCTPNDLFEWDAEKEVPSDHPIYALERSRHNDLSDRLSNLSIEELERLTAKREE